MYVCTDAHIMVGVFKLKLLYFIITTAVAHETVIFVLLL